MASLYKRKGSPFFWIEFRDLAGERRQKSTQFRHAVPGDVRKARAMASDMTAAENDPTANEAWSAWVIPFLRQRYAHSPVTLRRYEGVWRNVATFLEVHGISFPRQLNRQHVRAFIEWRQQRHADCGIYECSKNTALHEIKLLRIIMHEAQQCGYSTINPCSRLGVKPDAPPQKPRISETEHAKIVKALEQEPEWMRVSYQIAWEQGCRFSETCLHVATQVDLVAKIIRFRTKGHKDTLAEFPLSPRLVPLFEKMISEGREWTFDMPDMPGKAWWRFFRRIGLRHLCFHCTRVTFVSRCYDAGISRDLVMRLVGHSDYAVHAVYPRLSADHSSAQAMRALV